MFGNNNGNDGDDSDDNNSGVFSGVYDFFRGDDESQDREDEQAVPEPEPEPVDPNPAVKRWSLGDHNVTPGIKADQFDSEIDRVAEVNPGLADVLREAQDMVATANVSRFECGVCGLGHQHDDQKHDIRGDYEETPGFSIESEFAENMEFSPYCHCGVNELAMLIDFFTYLPQPVFRDQHRFEGVLEVGNDALITYCQTRRDLEDEAEFGEDVTLEAIGLEAEFDSEVVGLLDELGDEPTLFYERWRDIKRGANGAPIAGETRQAIGNLREFIENELGVETADTEADEVSDAEWGDDVVDDRDQNLGEETQAGAVDDTDLEGGQVVGEVTFYNSTGRYGFIDAEGVSEDVFFHLEGTEFAHLNEGTEVTLDVEESAKGPRADNIDLVEDDDEDDDSDDSGLGSRFEF